jgi:mannose-6-phosphate isomerase-like protein (cupin superfamily)
VIRKVDKKWGVTRLVEQGATHEVWHASIAAGGYSSKHRHTLQSNLFYVMSGEMVVYQFADRDAAAPHVRCLVRAGESFVVPAGVWHKFETLTPVELIETYQTTLSTADIERADEGGVLTATPDAAYHSPAGENRS